MYLYIVKSKGFHKIGITQDFKARLGQLQTANPFKIEGVCLFEFGDALPIERSLHQKYASKRASGEWFSLSDADIEDILVVCDKLGGKTIRISTQYLQRWSIRDTVGYAAFTCLFMTGLLAFVMYGVSQ